MMINVWEERIEQGKKRVDDARTAYDTDYARVIHSASFRRLQGKTQILSLGDSDFYRTRLTHSLEVSQVAMGIVRQLRSSHASHAVYQHLPAESTLTQVLGLCHDLGHPPFGHGGEVALNYCMRKHGGFEGNGQTLRILTKLEKMSENAGLNLTRRSLLGILKYPVPYSLVYDKEKEPKLSSATTAIQIIDRENSKPPKCYLDSEETQVKWILSVLSDADRATFQIISPNKKGVMAATHKSLDCSIMDAADDIAYGIHDLEDAIALKLITEEQFREDVPEASCRAFLDNLNTEYSEEFGNDTYSEFIKKLFSDGKIRKRQISRLVFYFITNIEVCDLCEFQDPLLRYRVKVKDAGLLEALKKAVSRRVIRSPNVQQLEFKGQKMVVSVFEAIASEPKSFLPEDFAFNYEQTKDVRVICDYIAGMTDAFLLKTYDRLFSPHMGSVFDRI